MNARLLIRGLFGLLAMSAMGLQSATGQPTPAEPPQGPVTVHLASGRSFTAAVDRRTDQSRLWLRWTCETMSVLRPIDWDRVVQGELDGKPISKEALRRAVAPPGKTVATEADASRLTTLRVFSWPLTDSLSTSSARAALGASSRETIGPDRRETPPVRALAIDAWVANWDSDVEVDGLAVEVRPLGADGAVVPVHGTLEVHLIGWRSGRTRSEQAPVRLGRWTRSVDPEAFGSSGAECHLTFQAVHPEFDLPWAPHGTVHARLSVPGQGVFEATQSTVRIRPYSALRDHLEQITGQRFYPLERTGRGRR